MQISQMRFARLDRQKLSKLREVEAELGNWLVVLEPDMETVELPDEQVQVLGRPCRTQRTTAPPRGY